MSTLYYDPEQAGLTIVGEVSWTDEPYSFDLTVVWRDESGQLYYADDSGCSCPGHFDGYYKVEDLTKATSMEIGAHLQERLDDRWSKSSDSAGQAADLMLKIVSL
jgi:hypothetical protein